MASLLSSPASPSLSRPSINPAPDWLQHRFSPASRRHAVKCGIHASLRFDNGPVPPSMPAINDRMLPGILPGTRCLPDGIGKQDSRLRIFSGTANPALAQIAADDHNYHI